MFWVAFIGLFSVVNSCTFDGCNHPDYGSCGNACCRLNILIEGEDTLAVMNKLNNSIVQGGPDKRYFAMITADDYLTFRDLRPKNVAVDFLGQAYHLTANLLYNDTVNILLSKAQNGVDTNVFAFSISQIGGAWGDSGQNYFNIIQLFDSIWSTYKLSNADGSCPLAA
jgi:hypothetical protein